MLLVVLIVANSIGSIPLIITLLKTAATNPGVAANFEQHPGNLGILGIDPTLGLVMLLLPFVAGLAAFILLVKPLHGRSFGMIINGTGTIRWHRFFISALVWTLLSAVYLIIYLKLDPANFVVNNNSKTLIVLIVISLIFIPFQAALEEVLFRGYLMQGFTLIISKRWFPLIMTSVFFGLLHSFNPEVKDFGFFTMMPHYIIFGLLFGVITILDDGIEAAMGAHAANNVFLCVMVTQESSALQTAAVYEQQSVSPWFEFTALVLTGILFIFILKKLFRWHDFSALTAKIEEKPGDQMP